MDSLMKCFSFLRNFKIPKLLNVKQTIKTNLFSFWLDTLLLWQQKVDDFDFSVILSDYTVLHF